MATDCDCILTTIDNPFKPGNFFFDFKQSLVTSPGHLDIDFQILFLSGISIEAVKDKSDNRSTSIVIAPLDPGKVRYTFNSETTYWTETTPRTDTFTMKLKDDFSGEISVVNVTIRSIGEDEAFSPSDITILVTYPYPSSLKVDINYGWPDPTDPPVYITYKTGYTDPAYVKAAYVPIDTKGESVTDEVRIDLQALASLDATTRIPYYVANVATGPVNESSDTIAFAYIILEFEDPEFKDFEDDDGFEFEDSQVYEFE